LPYDLCAARSGAGFVDVTDSGDSVVRAEANQLEVKLSGGS
jgi:hypothetical protein